MTEEWHPIPGYDGYEASSLGRVRSCWKRGGSHTRTRELGTEWRVLRGWVAGRGWRYLNLVVGDASRTRPVHQVVAEAFHGPCPEAGSEVRHLDGDSLNNRPDNLAWGSHAENMQDIVRHGYHHNAIKTQCKRGHPFDDANTYIIPGSGSRVCRTCRKRTRQPD